MMKKYHFSKRILSTLLGLALLMTYIPLSGLSIKTMAASSSIVTNLSVDPGTADSWESMMGAAADGNRYAGRVWVDKSFYKDGDVAKLSSRDEAGSRFTVSLADDEAFQVIFSALGSSMTTTSTTTRRAPLDVVLVLDNSISMNETTTVNNRRVTRMQQVIEAAPEGADDPHRVKALSRGPAHGQHRVRVVLLLRPAQDRNALGQRAGLRDQAGLAG